MTNAILQAAERNTRGEQKTFHSPPGIIFDRALFRRLYRAEPQADRTLRPLVRRRARTLRPLDVAIRFRKPWTLDLWRFLG